MLHSIICMRCQSDKCISNFFTSALVYWRECVCQSPQYDILVTWPHPGLHSYRYTLRLSTFLLVVLSFQKQFISPHTTTTTSETVQHQIIAGDAKHLTASELWPGQIHFSPFFLSLSRTGLRFCCVCGNLVDTPTFLTQTHTR